MNFNEFINALKRAEVTEKEYSNVEDIVKDACNDVYKDEYDTIKSFDDDKDLISNQNVPYVVVFHKYRGFLYNISRLENVSVIDKELYIAPMIDKPPFERATTFGGNYELKEGERFYVELDPNKPIYEFVKNDLCNYCKECEIDLHVESFNENGINCSFDIDKDGKLKSTVQIEGGTVALENYLYQMYVILEMFGSTSNLLECNPIFDDVDVE